MMVVKMKERSAPKMFTTADLMMNTMTGSDSAMEEQRQAVSLFQEIQHAASRSSLLAFLTGRTNRLQSLERAASRHSASGRHSLGTRSVAISQIRGSETRTNDFDRRFRPLNSRTMYRWTSILMARLNGIPLPAVDLIKVGDTYFVRDGHHRISVAAALGQQFIEADVTEW
jgi:hypothetical protein